jgi:hypothetical protein
LSIVRHLRVPPIVWRGLSRRQAALALGARKSDRDLMAAGEKWKMPPAAKIYEALGALGDGRVTLIDETHARVRSSDGSKTYDVETSPDGREISSNDNASYWRGYLGYPGVAVMLARGLLVASPDVVAALTGVPWKELNRRFRNDYAKTIAEVEARMIAAGAADPAAVRAEVAAVMRGLERLGPVHGGRRERPPAEKKPRAKARPKK